MVISDPTAESFLQCLSSHSVPSPPISSVTYFPSNPSYDSILQSYIRNLRFASPSTPKPLFIVTPSHVSHIQTTIICCKTHGLEMRIRSGGHDYDGLSYVSAAPFVILDMFDFRIAEKSKVHGFPAGVCPTVGVGGHFSGGGYGNMMRKYGLSTDNILDAVMVDAEGRILDRESMGEDLLWAIRGGGGASFGTLEQGATDILHQWQYVADKIHEGLFIRVVVLPQIRKGHETIKAKFIALFLGNAKELLDITGENFPELGLSPEDCIEMSWIESVLFWSNYPKGTPFEVLLDRQPQQEKYLKKKSDYVQEPISKTDLEGIWKKMIELERPAMTLNPYGGKTTEISTSASPFPHRAGNLYKIQYSVTWKEESTEASNLNLDRIRKIYDFMTPCVSKSPRSSYLNYRDLDLGRNEIGNASYSQASVWGNKYFTDNFDRLVQVKSMVDPGNFFRYEQSIPSLTSWEGKMAE
ncbi:hypothetical protein SLEP1_g54017 [Rubroshorea leprosula]|uniref:FAD-binding PCMH-type domain-containing protein n=1 Tax=Rubroshorea leprosula TaxID=152421 RepID=A0AAV5MC87_9ROSI|nr:hypothetical protein SLEP1_g54017 [Rubroshorea leprosula]